MSLVQVKVVKIQDIQEHPNADRLSIIQVDGIPCIIGKDVFSAGDLAIYFPSDIVLPDNLVEQLFANSKVKPTKGRIKACKIRGVFSEGLLMPVSIIDKPVVQGEDLTEFLKCHKYEPPEEMIPIIVPKKQKVKTKQLPRYVDTLRYQHGWNMLFPNPDEIVAVTAKLHGTSARYGWVDVVGTGFWSNLWLKLRQWWGKPALRFVVGTRNVDRCLDEDTVYAKTAKKLNLPSVMKKGEVLFGEIVGDGIQGKGFSYGHKKGETSFYAYAVSVDGVWLPYPDMCKWCTDRGIPTVPLIALCKVKEVMDNKDRWYSERCDIEKDIPCREGFVVAPVSERLHPSGGSRTVVKFINPEYLLLKDPGDKH